MRRAENPEDPPRVVIVGGGFAGLAAARALAGCRAEVLLFDRQNHHLFQPLLYQVATASLSPANIASPIRKILRKQANCSVGMSEATAADLERRTVSVGGQAYAYDYLVLAAGARTNYFGHDAWRSAAPGLKTIDEAIDIRRRFLLAFEQAELEGDEMARRAALTFALVGAGPTGVELAGSIAEISRHTLRNDFRHFDPGTVRILLIDMADRVLPSMHPDLSRRAQEDLEKRFGVEVLLRTRVVNVEPGRLTIEREGRSEHIEANNVIWSAGVRAAAIAESLGVRTESGGRVVVGGDLSIPGHKEAFVVGDMASCVDASGTPVPGVAPAAMQMGRFVGRLIASEISARQKEKPLPVFRYLDKGSLATIGRNRAVAQIRGFRMGGPPAFLLWALVHIRSLIDFRNRFLTLADWIWTYFFYERGVRLITGENVRPRVVRLPPDPRMKEGPPGT